MDDFPFIYTIFNNQEICFILHIIAYLCSYMLKAEYFSMLCVFFPKEE